MKVAEIIAPLEALAPSSLQEEYDNSGLIVGQKMDEVDAVLVCLDCTEAVVDEAIASGCALVIAHHPIVFRGLKRFNGKNYVERVVQKAIKNDIALYACHTNLDKVHGGVNSRICEKLGLSNCTILQPEKEQLCKVVVFCPTEYAKKVRSAMFKAGAGHIGNYDECSFSSEGLGTFRASEESDPFVGTKGERHAEKEERIEVICPQWKRTDVVEALKQAHPYEEVAFEVYSLLNQDQFHGIGMVGELEREMDTKTFLTQVKNGLELDCFRYAGSATDGIKRVAVCGGSGADLIQIARSRGAQAFVTSDIKYHQFFDAEDDLLLVDVGHYESERFTIDLIAEILRANFPKFAIRLTGVDTNPVEHFQ